MTRSRSMAFREKLAWVTLGSMLIAYTLYFSLLATVFDPSLPDGPRTVQMLMLLGGVTVVQAIVVAIVSAVLAIRARREAQAKPRSEEHTSELQSLMRSSYAVFCLKKKTNQ